MKINKLSQEMVKAMNLDEDGIYYDVETDQSQSCGIIHFSHEISLTVKYTDGTVSIVSGWEIACEDVEWKSGDEEYFEFLHPGILDQMKQLIESNLKK